MAWTLDNTWIFANLAKFIKFSKKVYLAFILFLHETT